VQVAVEADLAASLDLDAVALTIGKVGQAVLSNILEVRGRYDELVMAISAYEAKEDAHCSTSWRGSRQKQELGHGDGQRLAPLQPEQQERCRAACRRRLRPVRRLCRGWRPRGQPFEWRSAHPHSWWMELDVVILWELVCAKEKFGRG